MIIKYKLKLILKPNKATPTPPIAPILAQYGINLMEFCKRFNFLTKELLYDFIYVKIIVFTNLTYEIILGNESLTNLIKKTINIDKFLNKPGKENFNFHDFKIIDEISKKRFFFEKKKISSIRKMILGTLISIGINYE